MASRIAVRQDDNETGMELTDLVYVFGTVCLALLTLLACLRWEPMMLLVLASAGIETYLDIEVGLKLGNLLVRMVDGLALVAFIAAILRLFVLARLDVNRRWWLAACLCLGLAGLYGSANFGLITMLSFYRPHFYISAIALYIMTFDFSAQDTRRALNIWVGFAVVIMLYTVLAKLDPSLIPETVHANSLHNTYSSQRVITAGAALVMCQAALICIGLWASASAGLLTRFLAVMLPIAMFVQYHRTTWLAFIVGALAIAQMNRRYLLRLIPIGATVVGLVVIIWLTGLASDQDMLTQAVATAISEPLDGQRSTAVWRIQGWQILVREAIADGPFRILVGAGFGVGYDRLMGSQHIYFSPHNLYVEIFLNAGVIGLLALLAFFAILLRQTVTLQRFSPADGNPYPALAAALLASILVYGIGYSLGYEQGLLLGLLAASLASQVSAMQQPAETAEGSTSMQEGRGLS